MNGSLEGVSAVREELCSERDYRRMLTLTDQLLTHLELLNLRGQKGLDRVTQRRIAATMCELTPRASARFPRARTVQEALDGLFEVQVELLVPLQRMLHWDRLISVPIGRSA